MYKRLNTFIVALVLILLLKPEVSGAATPLKKIAPDEFKAQVEELYPGTKYFYIFTSWCGYCKSSFPAIVDLHRKYKDHNDVHVIMLAIDDEDEPIQKFSDNFPVSDVNLVHLSFKNSIRGMRALRELGVNYNGKVPMQAVIAKDGNPLVVGNYSPAMMDQIITYAIEE
jgi:thiol-disulfide isomerase/thioredoxin